MTRPHVQIICSHPEHSSFGRVARGWHQGISAHLGGKRSGNCEYARPGSEQKCMYVVPTAQIFVGDPRQCVEAFDPNCPRRFVALFANSNRIPDDVLNAIREAKAEVITSSSWSEQIIGENWLRLFGEAGWEFEPLTTHVVHLGVDSAPIRSAESDWDGQRPVMFLHRTSSGTNRKGTEQLLDAWMETCHLFPPQSFLTVTVPDAPLAGLVRDHIGGSHPNVLVMFKRDLSEDVAAFHRRFDLCIQPSAEEAWGMVPLECLSVGVPAIISDCGGYMEWYSVLADGVIGVERTVREAAGDPGGEWMSVTAESIAKILEWVARFGSEDGFDVLPDLQYFARQEAEAVQKTWSWEAATKEFVEGVICG